MTTVRRRIKDSQKQESRGALIMGGRVRPGSGSIKTAKGDVRVGRGEGVSLTGSGVLIEYKRTDRKSISFSIAVLEKIRGEALLEGRTHLLGFQLGRRNYIVLEEHDFLAMVESAQGGSDR